MNSVFKIASGVFLGLLPLAILAYFVLAEMRHDSKVDAALMRNVPGYSNGR